MQLLHDELRASDSAVAPPMLLRFGSARQERRRQQRRHRPSSAACMRGVIPVVGCASFTSRPRSQATKTASYCNTSVRDCCQMESCSCDAEKYVGVEWIDVLSITPWIELLSKGHLYANRQRVSASRKTRKLRFRHRNWTHDMGETHSNTKPKTGKCGPTSKIPSSILCRLGC